MSHRRVSHQHKALPALVINQAIGNVPPAEAEDRYYAAADNIDMAA